MSPHPPREPPPPPPPDPRAGEPLLQVRTAFGLMRIASAAWWRTAEWGALTSLRAGTRVLRAAATGESPASLFADVGHTMRAYVREALEVAEIDVTDGRRREPARHEPAGAPAERDGDAPITIATLRGRGAELLRRSADVHFDEDVHPAYGHILSQLAPDEGRILRLLTTSGPQPCVDVRASRPLKVGSEVVAERLNMLALEAGCRHPEWVETYLDNLCRLALIHRSAAPVADDLRYQVLEAQPEVVAAMEAAGRGRTARASFRLTRLGADFCEICLPRHTAELDELPGDARWEAEGPPSDEP